MKDRPGCLGAIVWALIYALIVLIVWWAAVLNWPADAVPEEEPAIVYDTPAGE